MCLWSVLSSTQWFSLPREKWLPSAWLTAALWMSGSRAAVEEVIDRGKGRCVLVKELLISVNSAQWVDHCHNWASWVIDQLLFTESQGQYGRLSALLSFSVFLLVVLSICSQDLGLKCQWRRQQCHTGLILTNVPTWPGQEKQQGAFWSPAAQCRPFSLLLCQRHKS